MVKQDLQPFDYAHDLQPFDYAHDLQPFDYAHDLQPFDYAHDLQQAHGKTGQVGEVILIDSSGGKAFDF